MVGEAGSGKTSVVRAAADRAQARLAEGGGVPALSWMPGLPLRRAVGLPVPISDPPATAELLAAVLDGRVLFIDDVQWCDGATLDVVGRLAARRPVVAARRQPPPASPRVGSLDAVAATITLAPLDDTDGRHVVRTLDPALAPWQADEIVRRAAGNPLVIEHLVTCSSGRSAEASTPSGSLRHSVAAQLAELSVVARTSFAALGLLGRPAPPSVLGEGVEELAHAKMVRLERGLVVAHHAVIAELAASMLPAETRSEMHARLARLVTDPAEQARHHAAAGESGLAARCALRAAERAATAAERAEHLSLAATHTSGDRAYAAWTRAAEAFLAAGDDHRAARAARAALRATTAGSTLSPRESEVIALVGSGHTTAAIARRLRLSTGTIETHVRSAMGKLGARTRTEAAVLAADAP
ncbi:hypothetical protein BH20ACT4_BH20ACT4_04060 [soil metagenome]